MFIRVSPAESTKLRSETLTLLLLRVLGGKVHLRGRKIFHFPSMPQEVKCLFFAEPHIEYLFSRRI